MNFLEGSILHITMPGDYTCNIVRVDYNTAVNTVNTCLYILYEKSTGHMYWVTPIYFHSSTTTFKLFGQIVIENGINKLRINDKILIKRNEMLKENYIFYAPSVKLYRIPSSYKIENDKRQWNEYCKYVEENELILPIRMIVDISELKRFITEFL